MKFQAKKSFTLIDSIKLKANLVFIRIAVSSLTPLRKQINTVGAQDWIEKGFTPVIKLLNVLKYYNLYYKDKNYQLRTVTESVTVLIMLYLTFSSEGELKVKSNSIPNLNK